MHSGIATFKVYHMVKSECEVKILRNVEGSDADVMSFRALSAETGSAARPLRPRHEGFVPRAERRPAGCSEAAAAGQLVRPQTNQRFVSNTE